MSDEFYMRLALEKAWQYQGLTYPNPAVGCALLNSNGKLLAVAAHKKAGYAHAELSALFTAVFREQSDKEAAFEIVFDVLSKAFKDGVNKFEKSLSSSDIKRLSEYVLTLYNGAADDGISDDLYIYSNSELKGASGVNTLFRLAFDEGSKDELSAKFKPFAPSMLSLAHNLMLAHPAALYDALISRASRLGLAGGTAYVSLEPCSHHGRTPPCARLLAALNLSRVVVGARDPHDLASGGESIVSSSGAQVSYAMQDEAEALLAPFISWQLAGGFRFAKLALSANGVATGGTISSQLSRTHMHALRSRLDLLAIGGGTVRADNPRLDARLVGAKAPNVAIFTRSSIDKNALVFDVPGREVRVQNGLLFDDKFIMFEGAQGLLELIASGKLSIKWLLLYQSSELKDVKNLRINLRLKPLYEGQIGGDRYGWYEIV